MGDAIQEAKRIFRERGGILRTSELDRLARGIYRLADLPPLSNPDLVVVALRIPNGVICLVSALAFHRLTTEIPHTVDVAVEKGSWRPRLEHPPLRVFWFSGPAWREGIGTYDIDGVSVRITTPSKTVADMFKFRRQLGLDLALEALKEYRDWDTFEVGELLHYARSCRVEKVITPYLEALL